MSGTKTHPRPGFVGRPGAENRAPLQSGRWYASPGRGQLLFAWTAKGWLPVGEVVRENGMTLLRKRVDSRRHKLRRPEAYGLEVSLLAQAEALGVRQVELFESDTGRVLTASLSAFREHGVEIQRGGFAPQLALPLAWWSARDPRQQRLL